MELWDVYDKNGIKKGRSHRRGDPLPTGDYHMVVENWIRNSTGDYLIQKRNKSLRDYVNPWSSTAGAATKGENSIDAIQRETREEMGLFFEKSDLHFVERTFFDDFFMDVYESTWEGSLNEIRFDPVEVSDVRWVTKEDMREMYKSREFYSHRTSYLQGILNSSEMTYKHIHILGASGSGTSTLARKLCKSLIYKHLDSDDFFWKTKYSEINPREVRLDSLRAELVKYNEWVLSGAVIDWGNPLIPLFDLVIFLSVPNEIRLKRLEDREFQRYGEAISPGGDKHGDFEKFMEWANRYETGGPEVRSRHQQEVWLDKLSCPVWKIDGEKSAKEISKEVLEKLTH